MEYTKPNQDRVLMRQFSISAIAQLVRICDYRPNAPGLGPGGGVSPNASAGKQTRGGPPWGGSERRGRAEQQKEATATSFCPVSRSRLGNPPRKREAHAISAENTASRGEGRGAQNGPLPRSTSKNVLNTGDSGGECRRCGWKSPPVSTHTHTPSQDRTGDLQRVGLTS